ncbi:MAG: hydantoinase/oxoprolinase family protein [Candidatus Lustribacter sp.]
MNWRVGVDVGGTFTDLVATDAGGTIRRFKVATTPKAPEEGLLDALRALLREVDPAEIVQLAHASTIATNALLGQVHLDLPRVAFVTTEGFRDVLEIGRQARSAVYDLHVRRPVPLARREDRLTVRERIDYDGSVHVALDHDSVGAAVATIRDRGIASVAVGLLNSYANDAHERAVAGALRAALPGVEVSESSALVREEREYERFSTAVVNAALLPVVRGYLERLAAGVRALGITAPVFVMQSNGGTAALPYVAERPATLIESGPASGVIAAAAVGAQIGAANVLSFDMGGTTAKAGTIVGGRPEIAYEFEAAGSTHSGRASKGSGYPVRFPFVDLAEVSAGGGTIARLDAVGVLRVGPLSAGADPGPACYGRGTEPTVTDANVVLGRLNPGALVGGTFPIDAAHARAAVASVAAPLGGDVERTAAGIVALVDAEMAKVLRIVSVERGLDPRDFLLMAFGGGGPLHACALAADLGLRRVVIPRYPGLFSALGLLAADVRATLSRSLVTPLDAASLSAARNVASALSDEARDALREQGVAEDAMRIVAELDVRYAGQSFDLTVPFDGDENAIVEAFHQRHERRYGYASRDERVELATVRVTAIGSQSHVTLSLSKACPEPVEGGSHPVTTIEAVPRQARDDMGGARIGTRRAWDAGAFADAAIYDRERLRAGDAFTGPAIVEQYDTTTWVPSGWRAQADDGGNLQLEKRA